MTQINKISPTMLVILDGFGYRKETTGNAIAHAKMPTWKKILQTHPHTYLKASGEAVGLPTGYMGNSEVGHTCMGAGRIIKTNFEKINETIKNKSFFSNEKLINLFTALKHNKKSLHLIGLLSDAGVHSHIEHFFAFIKLAKQVGIQNVFIHAILDGRDTPQNSASVYLKQLENFCTQQQFGKIATIHGRFYAMDRDKNWDRTEKCYNALCGNNAHSQKPFDTIFKKKSLRVSGAFSNDSQPSNWHEILDKYYKNNVTDEFIEPTILNSKGTIQNGDGIAFLNFRPDRARQLTQSFIDPGFTEFKKSKNKLEFFFTTTRYDETFKQFPNDILFEQETIEQTLLDEISTQTMSSKKTSQKVFIIAETEKYAHVTYFFRGKRDIQLPHETRVLIPSIKAKTYINHPEMSANKITAKLIESLQKNPDYFYLVNYANSDMVGHSGDFDATVKACECLDKQIKILYEEVVGKQNGTIFFTSDHGNAEEMEGKLKGSHTTNPVPFVMCNQENSRFPKKDLNNKLLFGISNIAPTILKYLNLKIPKLMKNKVIYFS